MSIKVSENIAAGYIRSPPNNNPVEDITSDDMTCNVNNIATGKTVTVADGSKITFEWHHDSNSASDDIIASLHKGPAMAYIAPTSSNGTGDVWVKLAEEGYDASNKLWAVDNLITNREKVSFTFPSVLADGDYLLRGEIIASHEADTAYSANSARGAQFYMDYTDPGVVFNLYGSFDYYTIPGPAVWDAASSGTSTGSSSSSSAAAVVVSSSVKVLSSAVTTAIVTSSSSSSESLFTTFAESVTIETTLSVIQSPTSAAVISSITQAVASFVASSASSSKTKSACKVKSSTLAVAAPLTTTSASASVSSKKSACTNSVAKSTSTASASVSSKKSACTNPVAKSTSTASASSGSAGSSTSVPEPTGTTLADLLS